MHPCQKMGRGEGDHTAWFWYCAVTLVCVHGPTFLWSIALFIKRLNDAIRIWPSSDLSSRLCCNDPHHIFCFALMSVSHECINSHVFFPLSVRATHQLDPPPQVGNFNLCPSLAILTVFCLAAVCTMWFELACADTHKHTMSIAQH